MARGLKNYEMNHRQYILACKKLEVFDFSSYCTWDYQ